MRLAPLSLVLCAGLSAQTAPAWKSIYYHDTDTSALSLHDIQWAGQDCVFALGVQTSKGRGKSVSLRSIDGGASWSMAARGAHGRSSFFLSERLGWLATEEGVERTGDCGQTWEKVSKQKGLVRTWFRDEALGWAAGIPKKALATRDGGRTWTDIQPTNPPQSDPARSAYGWVQFFDDKFGSIVGWHQPERRDQRFPVWMDPQDASLRRQWPSLTLMLQTIDGGAKWSGFSVSLMGRLTRIRYLPSAEAVALVEFDETFEYPSELHLIAGTKVRRIYRDKRHAVSDIAVSKDGWVYLAGVETVGTVRLPVPGKVRIMRSRDLVNWAAIPADYRAAATRVHLAAGPDGKMIAATDQGMILRLQ